jgi:hypothetical protein
LETKAVMNYNRYVHDNLITTEQQIMNTMNNIHLNLQFSLTYQNSNCLDYPDLLSIKKGHKQEIDIYKKPATTGTTIHCTSNHPSEHKLGP